MSKFTCLFVCVILASFRGVLGFREDEAKHIFDKLVPFVADCAKENNVDQADIAAAQDANRASEDLPPCFLACLIKKTKGLNDRGEYTFDTALDLIQEYLNPGDLPIYRYLAKACAPVNDQPVSDGEAGCERAKLVFACWQAEGIQVVL